MKCFLGHLVRNRIVLKNSELNVAHNNSIIIVRFLLLVHFVSTENAFMSSDVCTLRNVTLWLTSSNCFPSQLHVAPPSCELSRHVPACSPWHPPIHQPARKSATMFCVWGTLCLCDKLLEDVFRKKAGDRFPKNNKSVSTGLVPPQSLAYISTRGFSSPTACTDRSLHSFRIPGPAPQSESLPCHHRVVLLWGCFLRPPQPHTPVCTHLHNS